MLLSEIFEQLQYGEFRQTNVVDDASSIIPEANYPQVISYINTGLTELHKRFNLKREAVSVDQNQAVFNYILHSDYSVANTASSQQYKYIQGNIFKNNLLKIVSVADELGCKLGLDDACAEDGITTTSFNAFQVPLPVDGKSMIVEYIADHDKIPSTTKPTDVFQIDISHALLEPLLFYVAARYFRTAPLLNGVNEGNDFMTQFEISCKNIEKNGMVNSEMTTHDITSRGWA